MQGLNLFIMDSNMSLDFFAETTLRRRINELYAAKIKEHGETVNELTYIGKEIWQCYCNCCAR